MATNYWEEFPLLSIRFANNVTSIVSPTASDDTLLGYGAGSIWIFATSIYICMDATAGIAIWKRITS
jgi:hypothetical protein